MPARDSHHGSRARHGQLNHDDELPGPDRPKLGAEEHTEKAEKQTWERRVPIGDRAWRTRDGLAKFIFKMKQKHLDGKWQAARPMMTVRGQPADKEKVGSRGLGTGLPVGRSPFAPGIEGSQG